MEKFFFNPKTLKFQKVELSTRKKWTNFLKFISLISVFLISIFFASNEWVERPQYTQLEADQQDVLFKVKLLNQDVKQSTQLLEDIEYNDDHLYRAFFQVNPIPSTKRDAGTGGSQKYKSVMSLPFSNILIDTKVGLDDLSRKLVIQSKSFDEVIDLAETKEKYLAARPAIQPISITELTRFGSPFGMRLHPILKYWKPHNGIDLTCPSGTKIYCTADGVVKQAERTAGGYGMKILVDHGFGYATVYGHCSKIMVQRGQKVTRGEVIGLVGNTGLSTRSHLHYEVRINNKPVDPINYYANDLSANEYDKMISLYSEADPSFDIN